MNKYIIKQGDFNYIKDSLSGRNLLVGNIKNVQWLPSNGEDFTLYVLASGEFYYSSNTEFSQVIPEEQFAEEQINTEEDELDKKKIKK